VQVLDPHGTAVDASVRIGQGCSTRSQRLDLRSGEDDSSFDALFDLVIVTSAAVRRDGSIARNRSIGLRLGQR
jgi:hypothetical protein